MSPELLNSVYKSISARRVAAQFQSLIIIFSKIFVCMLWHTVLPAMFHTQESALVNSSRSTPSSTSKFILLLFCFASESVSLHFGWISILSLSTYSHSSPFWRTTDPGGPTGGGGQLRDLTMSVREKRQGEGVENMLCWLNPVTSVS